MLWEVTIPAPSAKRMAGSGKLSILESSGWCVGPIREIILAADQASVQFHVSDEVDWSRDTSMIDGPVFDVWVDYSNTSGSRKSRVHLVPQRVKS